MIFTSASADGAPGTLLASNNFAAVSARTVIGTSTFKYYNLSRAEFALPSVFLEAGDYYFALQANTTTVTVYLSSGISGNGGAETRDHGDTWTTGYQGYSSIALTLYEGPTISGVPEPASWTLMIAGFGLVGTTMRHRAKQSN